MRRSQESLTSVSWQWNNNHSKIKKGRINYFEISWNNQSSFCLENYVMGWHQATEKISTDIHIPSLSKYQRNYLNNEKQSLVKCSYRNTTTIWLRWHSGNPSNVNSQILLDEYFMKRLVTYFQKDMFQLIIPAMIEKSYSTSSTHEAEMYEECLKNYSPNSAGFFKKKVRILASCYDLQFGAHYFCV